MRRFGILSILFCTCWLVTATAAGADTLDDYLQPYCGVEPAPVTPEQIIARFGPEILARSQGFRVMSATPENTILMWYLGAMRTPASLPLAEAVMHEGLPEFQRMVMGAVSARPDWAGLRLVALGAQSTDEMTRDSASSILADLDFTTLSTQGTAGATISQDLMAVLNTAVAQESDPRLRGNFDVARGKLSRWRQTTLS